jgi:hypothetical protein
MIKWVAFLVQLIAAAGLYSESSAIFGALMGVCAGMTLSEALWPLGERNGDKN